MQKATLANHKPESCLGQILVSKDFEYVGLISKYQVDNDMNYLKINYDNLEIDFRVKAILEICKNLFQVKHLSECSY